MNVIATIGKSDVNYLMPDFKKAKEVNWKEDIEIFSKLDTSIMLVDEFIVDGYDWDLTSKILHEINKTNSLSGLITSFPYKTTDSIINELDTSLFDFYMIPINKVAYMMDTPSFLKDERDELKIKLQKLDKKIIGSKILAAGILRVEEAFNFINTLGYIDLATIGIGTLKEAREDFFILKSL